MSDFQSSTFQNVIGIPPNRLRKTACPCEHAYLRSQPYKSALCNQTQSFHTKPNHQQVNKPTAKEQEAMSTTAQQQTKPFDIKNIRAPDEFRELGRMRTSTLRLPSLDRAVMHAVIQPGWKWSIDVKPKVNTNLCEHKHLLFFLSGQMMIRAKDGTEQLCKKGDLVSVAADHDAWVIGTEVCECLDFGETAFRYGLSRQNA
eukprot:TRINITY_DN1418_c0_g2_i1.p1 TRINITY_DN1418_c0_g2~~TRINITY_DN1418_c0_g2_i1.p1  ORF type:complete len:201 (+),score=27.21 TRINITY_DN1418_c0_g2_i1:196-798(+)